MQAGRETPTKMPRALLCLSDADTELTLKMPIFGQPLVYHLLKNLYSLGISEIALSVETVAPELLTLIDHLKLEGLEPVVLRKGAEALQFVAKAGSLLLQNAAIWVARDVMEQIISANGKLLLTLPEDPRFRSFERIDLSRRWAGIAVLDGTLARQSPPIAEGWSIDSCLLRAALQGGYPDRILTDEALTKVVHVRSDNLQQMQKSIGAAFDTASVNHPSIASLADIAIQKFAPAQWWQGAVDFAAPVIATNAAIFAFFGYPTAALSLATVALFAREIRGRWRQVSYLKPTGDVIDFAALGLLLLTLYLGLSLAIRPFDAAFLALTLVGVVILGQITRHAMPKLLVSPLVVASALALLSIGGYLVVGTKIAIIALILSLVANHLRQ